MKRYCVSCNDWWPNGQASSPSAHSGDCRRHAPSGSQTKANGLWARWPETLASEGCGEWREATQKPAPNQEPTP